jgi:hypothetical protein
MDGAGIIFHLIRRRGEIVCLDAARTWLRIDSHIRRLVIISVDGRILIMSHRPRLVVVLAVRMLSDRPLKAPPFI